MKKSFNKKYPLAALIICLFGLFLGKPVEEFFIEETAVQAATVEDTEAYTFRSQKQLTEHFEKHGKDMGFSSEEEYLQNANRVISSPEALHKLEAEDLDDVYYLENSNEFVIVSSDGFIRTYFSPEDGIDYYNRQ